MKQILVSEELLVNVLGAVSALQCAYMHEIEEPPKWIGDTIAQFRQVIRKVDPYRDFKIDDKVEVRDDEDDKWCPRHFAGVIGGIPYTFANGRSSFTAETGADTIPWIFCRKYNEEN